MAGQVIDWQEIRERLGRVATATESKQNLAPARAKTRMDERARRLAESHRAPTDAANQLPVVTFTIARERYAIAASFVREIVPFGDAARVPGAADLLRGVINLRGELLPVVDLRVAFGLARPDGAALSRTIVLGRERADLGILAEAVHEVTTVAGEDVLAAPRSIGSEASSWVRGVTADSLIVLDGAAVLNDPRLFFEHSPEAGAEPGR